MRTSESVKNIGEDRILNVKSNYLSTDVNNHNARNPYTDISHTSLNASGNSPSMARSESDEAIEKWNYVFKLQKSRWEEEFDDIKKKFLKKVDMQRDSQL